MTARWRWRAGLGITLHAHARTLVEQFGLVVRRWATPVVERGFWVFTRRGWGCAVAGGAGIPHISGGINLRSSRVCAGESLAMAFPVASTATELVPRQA